MTTPLDCLPCFTRQAVDLARSATENPEEQERLARRFLRFLSDLEWSPSAPAVAQRLHALVKPLLRDEDPWEGPKREFNRMALRALPEARRKVQESRDPLTAALLTAAAGNVIDLGVSRTLTIRDVEEELDQCHTLGLKGDVAAFGRAVHQAAMILYIADNAGEIVFDKLVLELLPRERVTMAVRGKPVLNDATIEDAEAAGIPELVDVIDTGSDAPGILLDDCSREFREAFEKADLILAKGQGNLESLIGGPKEIYFLLKVKCDLVARQLGCQAGELVLYHYVPGQSGG
jgi:uncharacterized protein with ATP-grasp and redox domains